MTGLEQQFLAYGFGAGLAFGAGFGVAFRALYMLVDALDAYIARRTAARA